jgi:hypothetical protein
MPSYVKISMAEYTALLEAARPPVPAPSSQRSALGAAVGLITARLGGIPATAREIAPGTDPDAIIGALVMIIAAMMRGATLDHGADLLQALGLIGADQEGQR